MKRTTDGAQRRRARISGRRFGFTLVELLTVIAIIGMLGAISITTVRASIQSAKETQTRTTIAKIDNVLTACYEKYQYRRVDLKEVGIDTDRNPEVRARARLLVMRDILRCDFPCSPWELNMPRAYKGVSLEQYTPLQDAIISAVLNTAGTLSHCYYGDEDYRDYFGNEGIRHSEGMIRNFDYTDPTNGGYDLSGDSGKAIGSEYPHVANAELLYLVVMNADPEARAAFSEREIGDVDGNGLNEFVDGWGKPICWMRWAPSLGSSDRQPVEEEGEIPVNPTNDRDFDPNRDADPFDPMNVGVDLVDPDNLNVKSNAVAVERGWFLVPYVFSAGPDGKYGLVMPSVIGDYKAMNDPFRKETESFDVGLPYPEAPRFPTGKAHKDNIDNHTLVR